MNKSDLAPIDFVCGDWSGLRIPAHADALRAAGTAFLTEAFRRFNILSPASSISRITRFEPCPGGSTGHKLFLSVEYAQPEPGLYTDLFVKFSRNFTNPFFDRRRRELESEIRLALISRHPSFPIRVPVPYFADYHHDSSTGLLITQLIPFGRDGIEPHRPKCMDHELESPLAYYKAILISLARLAGAHKSGLLSREVEAAFPFDANTASTEDPIPYDERRLREVVANYAAFAAQCPQLLPPNITAPAFIARLEREAPHFLRHETAIKRFLHADRDYVALSHFNGNIDNAWFWRDTEGALQCGLMDWQRARQMNLGYALWGCLCGASREIWDDNLDELLTLFLDELHRSGGPQLRLEKLKLHLQLYTAMIGLAGLIESPALILSHLPEAVNASGPLDPVFHKSEAARSFLHISTNFLNLWEKSDFSGNLDRVLTRMRPT